MVGRLVAGIGINDAEYKTEEKISVGKINGKPRQKLLWRCPFNQTWKSVIVRGYSERFKEVHPTYKDCTVVEEWHLFSNFKSWMEQQDWEGKQLDKDLLFKGNKVYGPETCIFIDGIVNSFILESGLIRGDYMIGVHKTGKSFRATCCNPFTKKQEKLGTFLTEIEAHQAWLSRKLEHAVTLAQLQSDERVAEALISRYTNYEI